MIHNLRLLAAFLVLILGCCSGGLIAEESRKPNIILIVADDLGGHDLSCYGSKFHRTPNLDRLSTEGLQFTDAYSASPVCSPTRVSLMTGRHPARVGVTDWLPGRPNRPDQKLNRPEIPMQLPLESVTIAEALKAEGYTTWHIGKWHLGGAGFGPLQQGFDVNIGGDETGTPRSYFAPFKNGNNSMPGLENAPDGQYLTDRLTDEAEKLIDNAGGKPFFMYMAHYAVHTPMKAKDEITKTYDATGIAPGRQRNPIYASMLQSLDESVGRIVKKIDERGLTNETWIIFTSDNGGLATTEGPNTPATSNAPDREGKGWLYEGGLKVPLIIKGPGLKTKGVTTSQTAYAADLPATIAGLAGSSGKLQPLDGIDLGPFLTESKTPARDTLFWHYPHYANQGGHPGGVVRQGDWKLVEFYENNRRELFNLKTDKSESRNLSAENPQKVEELAKKLAEWRIQTGAKMPTTNPDFVPDPQSKNGVIQLPARTADVTGIQLRYEPQPHKNTLGFWVNETDTAHWDFQVNTPGRFEVIGLIGCGPGQGGSEVGFILDDQKPLVLTVPDTGGFQAFQPMKIGEVEIQNPGRHRLLIKPLKKAKSAVMDVRQVTLKPVE